MSEEIVDVNTAVEEDQEVPCWTFLSNHALVMMCLVDDPTSRMRDIAVQVGITERAVQRILTELEAAGYLQRHREGRRNFYVVDLTQPMRHPMVGHSRVSDLLRLRLRNNDKTIHGEGASALDHQPGAKSTSAANGSSYGRRRGPVPRQAGQPEETNGKKETPATKAALRKAAPAAAVSTPPIQPSQNGHTRGRGRKVSQTA